MPAQTIGKLHISGATTVTLQAGAANTLVIGAAAADSLSVSSGSQLKVSGTSALIINVATGAKGTISGSIAFSSTANTGHQLTAADASGITFNSGATFTQGLFNTGNVFGSGTANSVVFASGSTFAQLAGSNPFQKTQPASVVVFQTGSLFSLQQATAPSFSGRTYANLEFAGGTVNISTAFGSSWTVDNLNIKSGSQLNFNHSSGTGNAIISVKGNLTVDGTFSFANNVSENYTVKFNGTTAQTISGAGTITLPASLAGVVIDNTTGVTLSRALTTSPALTVNGMLATGATLTTSGGAAINGTFRINQGGWATGGTWTYGASSTLEFANTSGLYGVNADVFWPAASGPVNLTVSGAGGLQMNVSRAVSGTFQTAAQVTGSAITLNGIAQINAGGYFSTAPIYGASSTLKYNTGATYGRGTEWSAASGTIGTTAGYPNNILISGNSTLNYPNSASYGAQTINGSLTVDSGSSFYMDYGSPAANGALTVSGSVSLAGNLSLGNQLGGDMIVKGPLDPHRRYVQPQQPGRVLPGDFDPIHYRGNHLRLCGSGQRHWADAV